MSNNPLLKALPPETDYLTYLTILEYNLTTDQLPVLHDILQDVTLTANIGWDLVHLLLPLLPHSLQCLRDVARLGNPREVVLKVTELLEEMRTGNGEVEEDSNGEEEENAKENSEMIDEASRPSAGAMVDVGAGYSAVKEGANTDGEDALGRVGREPSSTIEDENATSHPAFRESATSGVSETRRESSTRDLQFITMLEMLSVLHPRIKTKHPSRFLSTSLQAILPAYSQLARRPGTTEATIDFIKAVSGIKRPRLPPRKSSTAILSIDMSKSAPDPEAQDGAIGPDEQQLQTRLLQSFLTHIIEDYMNSILSVGDIPGLAWTSRLQEKVHPEKSIPNRTTYSNTFAVEDSLHERDTVVGQITALARDLGLSANDLISLVTKPEPEINQESESLPSSASNVPLSYAGSLYLLSAMTASFNLFDTATFLPHATIFPAHASILQHFVGDETLGGIGSEPEALLDSVLLLGFVSLNHNQIGIPKDDNHFNSYLQRLSLLSANTSSPSLRYYASLLTSFILQSHSSSSVRLAFIQDTLQHCPYENLKVSAVGWLKDEILQMRNSSLSTTEKESSSIQNPSALRSLVPLLFPIPQSHKSNEPTVIDYSAFQARVPFYLASLNLYYLLCSSPNLSAQLDIPALNSYCSIKPDHLTMLKDCSNEVQSKLLDRESSAYDAESVQAQLIELHLLDGTIDILLALPAS